jgi:hypothetical protein
MDGRGSIPGRFFFSTASIPALGPTQWVPGTLSPGVKQPVSEAARSPSTSAEVKNGGAVSALPTRFHGMVLTYLSTGTTLPFFT